MALKPPLNVVVFGKIAEVCGSLRKVAKGSERLGVYREFEMSVDIQNICRVCTLDSIFIVFSM